MRRRPVLELEGIERRFAGPPEHVALRSVTLAVDPGELVTVVGRSGSGKSTLLNVLGLLDRPTGGRYVLDGRDVRDLGDVERSRLRGEHIGFVFQGFELLPRRTALDNVMLAGLYVGTPRAERRARALEALDTVGLGHRAHQLPTTMSGGEKQRVAIARALSGSPSLLLCDEPTGNLDSASAAQVVDLLESFNAGGMTVVLITHDADIAARGARTFALHDGVLAEAAR
jgi:putative ABC transport system ATP-binding protein